MNEHEINQRASQLMEHINRQIMLCDNRNDLLILTFSMLNRSKEILDQQLGAERRKDYLKECI